MLAMRFIARNKKDRLVFDIIEMPINETYKNPIKNVLKRWTDFVNDTYGTPERLKEYVIEVEVVNSTLS